MKKFIVTALCVIAAMTYVSAQESGEPRKSFDEFRKSVLSDYSSFRKSVLDGYDKFLEGVWVEYDSFKGVESNNRPKPNYAPVAVSEDDGVAADNDFRMPSAEAAHGKPQSLPSIQPQTQAIPGATLPKPPVMPTLPPKMGAGANPAPIVARQNMPKVTVPFYGMAIDMELPEVKLRPQVVNNNDIAAQWRDLSKAHVDQTFLPAIRNAAESMGLNDYLTYTLVRDVVKATQPQVNELSRVSFTHFLLAHMGYDVRLAVTAGNKPLLLIPFKQMVYARPFLKIDGEKYFMFDEAANPSAAFGEKITTCKLPEKADCGQPMDLIIKPLKLPYTPHNFSIGHGGLVLNGTVNANIFPLLERYPQMPTGCFALSEVESSLRAQIVEDMKRQLSNISTQQAVDSLLHFVQKGFEYATDEQYHGFEKPYFFEEMLYYPKCDCEDRSIFYSYLLWNVLGVHNQLISFPGHESVGVSLGKEIKGTSYTDGNDTYYISDPTYIGANTGACMPSYRYTAPVVDLSVPFVAK